MGTPRADAYGIAWADLRRRRRLGWIGFALLATATALLTIAAGVLPLALFAVPLLFAAGALIEQCSELRCPECNRSTRRLSLRDGFAGRCPTCGVSVDTTSEAVDSAAAGAGASPYRAPAPPPARCAACAAEIPLWSPICPRCGWSAATTRANDQRRAERALWLLLLAVFAFVYWVLQK